MKPETLQGCLALVNTALSGGILSVDQAQPGSRAAKRFVAGMSKFMHGDSEAAT